MSCRSIARREWRLGRIVLSQDISKGWFHGWQRQLRHDGQFFKIKQAILIFRSDLEQSSYPPQDRPGASPYLLNTSRMSSQAEHSSMLLIIGKELCVRIPLQNQDIVSMLFFSFPCLLNRTTETPPPADLPSISLSEYP